MSGKMGIVSAEVGGMEWREVLYVPEVGRKKKETWFFLEVLMTSCNGDYDDTNHGHCNCNYQQKFIQHLFLRRKSCRSHHDNDVD